MLTLQIEDELADKFNELAELEHIGTTQLIKNVLREYLDDIRDARLAEQAIQAIESGEEALLDWDDVKKGLYDLDN